MTTMLPTMRTMKTLDAPGLLLLLLLPLGRRRIDDKRAKPLAARIVMKSSKKKDSTTKMTKSTMSMTALSKNVRAAADGDDCAKTMTVCAARTDCPRRPG